MIGAAAIADAADAQTAAPAPGPEPERSLNPYGFERIGIPIYSDDIMSVTNLHEFEEVGKKKISALAYDYIRAGAADDLTVKANRAAFGDYWIRRKVMVDVSHVDTSFDLFGKKIDHPIMLGPVGLRRLLHPDGDRLTILAAHKSRAILVGPRLELIEQLAKEGTVPIWWASSLGHAQRAEAEAWAKSNEQLGAAALSVSLDYPYSGARDLPSENHWESEWMQTPRYNSDGTDTITFQSGMIWPYVPSMRWEWFGWVRQSTKLPIVAKGITTGEDAVRAVKAGADAIAVSNHGGRTLDGAQSTLHALPEVVDAVGRQVPVFVDGGVRRGGDILKARALGAQAIMIGRPYLWGLAAFGQEGVQRVIEMLQGELRIALGLSGAPTLDRVNRSMIRPAWKAYTA